MSEETNNTNKNKEKSKDENSNNNSAEDDDSNISDFEDADDINTLTDGLGTNDSRYDPAEDESNNNNQEKRGKKETIKSWFGTIDTIKLEDGKRLYNYSLKEAVPMVKKLAALLVKKSVQLKSDKGIIYVVYHFMNGINNPTDSTIKKAWKWYKTDTTLNWIICLNYISNSHHWYASWLRQLGRQGKMEDNQKQARKLCKKSKRCYISEDGDVVETSQTVNSDNAEEEEEEEEDDDIDTVTTTSKLKSKHDKHDKHPKEKKKKNKKSGLYNEMAKNLKKKKNNKKKHGKKKNKRKKRDILNFSLSDSSENENEATNVTSNTSNSGGTKNKSKKRKQSLSYVTLF